MNKNKYLSRFYAKLNVDINIDTLAELQSLHMQHIPFENLDVIRRTPIYLNIESIYKSR